MKVILACMVIRTVIIDTDYYKIIRNNHNHNNSNNDIW